MQFLNNTLGQFFQFIHSGVSMFITNPNYSYGLAIILFTIIIRIILLPLNIKQTRSQVAMQAVQPEIKKIQDKYKNDPQKAQAEVMKLYKEKGANPMSGCLPMLIQLPILWALFYVFNNLNAIQGVSFLWIKDLHAPDALKILPILSGVTTYLSSLMMTPANADSAQAKQTSTMNIGMAIFMGFMSWNFKSALVLYWVTNNLIQIGQTKFLKWLDREKAEVNKA